MDIKSFSLCFIAIFVALDIIGTLPIYLGLTQKLTPDQKAKTVNSSMAVALTVAVLFVFVGQALFRFLGITVFDFKIAGGIVLLLISLTDLLQGPESAHKGMGGSSGIVPLAVPLITGPGVLTTLILQVSNFGYFMTILALVSNYALAWFLLRRSELITKIIGKDGTVVISKIAALLLAAIAVSMIRTGVMDVIAFSLVKP